MAQGTCSINNDECRHGGKLTRGWCSKHYQRWWVSGDPLLTTKTPEQRFWSFVDRRGDDECWHWTGTILVRSGYGQFCVDRRGLPAHRFAYELMIGSIPDGLTLDHMCHDPDECHAKNEDCLHRRCVNPAHLEPATYQANILRSSGLAAINAAKTHCDSGPRVHGIEHSHQAGRR